jgi:glycosyltransferase involved in cell wall biosynthesis
MVEAGWAVDVLCLHGYKEKREEEVNGVHVFRLPAKRTRGGKLWYLWEYGWFLLQAFFKLSLLHLRHPYQAVHVHNMPDILVFSAMLPRLSGAKVILDLHDPMPEVYMTKYSIDRSHPAIHFLSFLEKQSIKFAHIVFTPNIAFRDLFISRGCPEKKIHIVMNSPQETIFKESIGPLKKPDRDGGPFILMYHGAIMERNGLETALRALLHLQESIPNLRFDVYGDGDFVKVFLKRIKELGVEKMVHYYGYRPLETIAEVIQKIDVGIIPNSLSPFTNLNFPTRIFEYLSMAKPVITPKTKGILDYFDAGDLFFFEPGNPRSLAGVVLEVYRNPVRRQEILRRGMEVYQRHRWGLQQRHLIEALKPLLERSNA